MPALTRLVAKLVLLLDLSEPLASASIHSMRLLGRRDALELQFQLREAVIAPQTGDYVGVHADVFFVARSSAAPVTIEDAHLYWTRSPEAAPLAQLRWDRAVVAGRFRYPPVPLAIDVGSAPVEVTLTFADGLVRHDRGTPPPRSTLVLEIQLADGKRQTYDLWRVFLVDWQQPRAGLEWLR